MFSFLKNNYDCLLSATKSNMGVPIVPHLVIKQIKKSQQVTCFV